MASHVEPQVAPATAREGFDTRNQDLNVACNDKQELRWKPVCTDTKEQRDAKLRASLRLLKLKEAKEKVLYELDEHGWWDEDE